MRANTHLTSTVYNECSFKDYRAVEARPRGPSVLQWGKLRDTMEEEVNHAEWWSSIISVPGHHCRISSGQCPSFGCFVNVFMWCRMKTMLYSFCSSSDIETLCMCRTTFSLGLKSGNIHSHQQSTWLMYNCPCSTFNPLLSQFSAAGREIGGSRVLGRRWRSHQHVWNLMHQL